MSATQEEYKINLEIFEGPLDLLLHLIKKSHLDIYDIPISLILEQYLSYIEMMKELDIDLAGDFIYMASELSHIKSKLLLRKDDESEEDEGPDPRADLVQRLLEYQKYKQAAEYLLMQPILDRDVYKRPKEKKPEHLKDMATQALEIESFKLLNAFHDVLKNAKPEIKHEVQAERVSVTDRIYQIVEVLRIHEDSVPFESLFTSARTRGDLVVTFLAILEMTRLKMLQVFQSDPFGSIRVKRRLQLETDKVEASEFDQESSAGEVSYD